MADASDCDAFNPAATREDETEKEKEKEVPLSQEEEEEEQQQHCVLDSVQETAIAQEEQPLASAEMGQHSAGSELEAKKQRLLEELESALLPKGKPKDSTQDLPLPVPVAPSIGLGLGLGIEVIDETAVVETFSLPASSASGKGKKGSANANAAAKKDGNKQSSSRRRAKKDASKQHKNIGKKTATEPPITNTNGNGKKRRYLRKGIEALRFVNVDQQRTFWNAIYASLQPHVASEYDTLWAVAVATTSTNDAGACLPNKKQAPPILSVGAANGRWRDMNVFVH